MMEMGQLAALSLVFALVSVASGLYIAFAVRPRELFRRLEECEQSAPWAIARQELHAWTVETESVLEAAGHKLKTAQARGNRNAAKAAQPEPQAAETVPMDRRGQLELVRKQLGIS